VLLCFRVINAGVLALLGALALSSMWFGSAAVQQQFAWTGAAPRGWEQARPVLARLHDVRLQIHDDLCRRTAAQFLRAQLCTARDGI